MRSGRLTPAAATLTRIWPDPGRGVGRRAGFSASGPPGVVISIAIIVSGTLGISGAPWLPWLAARLAHLPGLRQERRRARLADPLTPLSKKRAAGARGGGGALAHGRR